MPGAIRNSWDRLRARARKRGGQLHPHRHLRLAEIVFVDAGPACDQSALVPAPLASITGTMMIPSHDLAAPRTGRRCAGQRG
jgi:hypothetical protein